MEETKSAISIADMARLVGLSRARFYQLMGTTFPLPRYYVSTRRPFYDDILQNSCLEVRRRNCGIDGKPILFYAKRVSTMNPIQKPTKKKVKDESFSEVFDGLKSLGLTTATVQQVASAVKELFPSGVENESRGQVLRAVFLHLKRRDKSDIVGK